MFLCDLSEIVTALYCVGDLSPLWLADDELLDELAELPELPEDDDTTPPL